MHLYTATQPVATNSRERAAESVPADLDPGTHPIIALHWFGMEPLHPIGPIAADVVADLQFRHQIERLHRLGPRVIGEILAHLGAKHTIRTSIEQTIEHFTELDSEVLEAAGGDEFWPAPIREAGDG